LADSFLVSGVILFVIYMAMDYPDEKRHGTGDAAKLADDEEFHVKDVLSLFANKSYLYIMLLCATFYAIVFPFQD
jgi:hypothetical protein